MSENWKVDDFATVERAKAGKPRILRYVVTRPDILTKYFAACAYKPAVLAERLGMHYQSLRKLLQENDLWRFVSTVSGKGSGANRKRMRDCNPNGYLYSTDPNAVTISYENGARRSRRKLRHIEVMEQHLGRPLNDGQCVHHINLDKTDNRIENLKVCSRSEHRKMHADLEAVAGRLIEAGYIAFVPELQQYVFVGPQPNLRRELANGGGFVRVTEVLGSDATVVNAARVSFGKSISEIRDQDKRLLTYLAEHGHTSPFRHVYVQFHVKAPEFVARQWYKHVVGSEYAFKDTAWNEISGRYVEYDLTAHLPTELRRQASDKKQGSSDEVVEDGELLAEFHAHVQQGFGVYKKLLDAGVAKEQARAVLPLSFHTEWYWTASLQAVAHFVRLRDHAAAQVEIQDYARMIDDCMATLFPNAWPAIRGASHD